MASESEDDVTILMSRKTSMVVDYKGVGVGVGERIARRSRKWGGSWGQSHSEKRDYKRRDG
jgi:hypothetical protein